MWDWVSFWIGFLFAFFLAILIFWLLYITRSFVYSNCPDSNSKCRGNDYIENPGVALNEGYKIDQILSVANGHMYYKRPPKSSNCTVGSNQTIIIRNPQYCQFTTNSGENFDAKSISFKSDTYSYVDDEGDVVYVVTEGDCQPNPNVSPGYSGGTILLKWDLEN